MIWVWEDHVSARKPGAFAEASMWSDYHARDPALYIKS
jgi:hypothetical protein